MELVTKYDLNSVCGRTVLPRKPYLKNIIKADFVVFLKHVLTQQYLNL